MVFYVNTAMQLKNSCARMMDHRFKKLTRDFFASIFFFDIESKQHAPPTRILPHRSFQKLLDAVSEPQGGFFSLALEEVLFHSSFYLRILTSFQETALFFLCSFHRGGWPVQLR